MNFCVSAMGARYGGDGFGGRMNACLKLLDKA